MNWLPNHETWRSTLDAAIQWTCKFGIFGKGDPLSEEKVCRQRLYDTNRQTIYCDGISFSFRYIQDSNTNLPFKIGLAAIHSSNVLKALSLEKAELMVFGRLPNYDHTGDLSSLSCTQAAFDFPSWAPWTSVTKVTCTKRNFECRGSQSRCWMSFLS
jgi:hypothetical protein